jgi:hypothetical protein
MESVGELTWFRNEVLRSILRPRAFARSLAREHYGLAGVLVAIAAGLGLSVAVDVLVLASKGIAPAAFVSRMLVEGVLLGIRLAITLAVLALIAFGFVRLTRTSGLDLDQAFTAIAFALSPLILAPVATVLVLLDPSLVLVSSAVLAVIIVRVLVGLVLNLAAILPPPVTAAALVVLLASGSIVLGDQVSRLRMTGYAIAPQLAAPLAAAPAEGKRYEIEGAALTVPSTWTHSTRGVAGEVAHFETASATLNVLRGRPEAFATIDAFADQAARSERLGFVARRSERSVVRIGEQPVVDDRAEGTYQGRRIALRQFAMAQGTNGSALQFRFFDPPDVEAAFAEAAAIAATWTVSPDR